MRRSFVFASVALIAAGCAPPHVTSTQLNKPPRELNVRAPGDVDVYTTQRPSRAYMEYASIDVSGGQEEKDRLQALRQRAGAIGCDAVLVTHVVVGQVQGMKATCVVFTEPASKDGAKETKEAGPGTKL